MPPFGVKARPFDFEATTETSALLVIDMQSDFLSPEGYLAQKGAEVSLLREAVRPIQRVLKAVRGLGLTIIHTREGHRPDLSDLSPMKQAKVARCGTRIGDPGPLGRHLIRGSKGHDFIEDLRPLPGEIVLDKPGKGAFYGTDLEVLLRNRGVTHLIFTGVTTNVCVQSTVREAADRGYWNLILEDACAAVTLELHQNSLEMFAYQGIFAQVASTADFLKGLPVLAPVRP